MSINDKNNCGGQCSCCSIGQKTVGGPQGWRLVFAAAGVFLLPLAAVLGMACFFRNNRTHQALAVFAVLAVMLIVSPVIYRIVRKRRGEADEQQ